MLTPGELSWGGVQREAVAAGPADGIALSALLEVLMTWQPSAPAGWQVLPQQWQRLRLQAKEHMDGCGPCQDGVCLCQ